MCTYDFDKKSDFGKKLAPNAWPLQTQNKHDSDLQGGGKHKKTSPRGEADEPGGRTVGMEGEGSPRLYYGVLVCTTEY